MFLIWPARGVTLSPKTLSKLSLHSLNLSLAWHVYVLATNGALSCQFWQPELSVYSGANRVNSPQKTLLTNTMWRWREMDKYKTQLKHLMVPSWY